jgi:hypothetical protein
MKNILLAILVIGNFSLAISQWTYKKVQNDFDDPYKIAYTGRNNEAILKLENVEVERTIEPKIIQDSIFTITKTEKSILIYDSVSHQHCLSRGYMSLYSDEYAVIYDVVICQPNNSITEETFYKVYANNRFGCIRATALTLNPNEVIEKLKRRTGDIDKIKAKELFEMNVNQKPKDVKIKELSFYLSGGYHCDESLTVDIVFYVGGNPKKYQVEGSISKDRTTVFLVDDLNTHEMKEDFLKASSVKLRFNESHCESDYYEFNMSNSKAAFQFMMN